MVPIVPCPISISRTDITASSRSHVDVEYIPRCTYQHGSKIVAAHSKIVAHTNGPAPHVTLSAPSPYICATTTHASNTHHTQQRQRIHIRPVHRTGGCQTHSHPGVHTPGGTPGMVATLTLNTSRALLCMSLMGLRHDTGPLIRTNINCPDTSFVCEHPSRRARGRN